jgi:hypothetical protein
VTSVTGDSALAITALVSNIKTMPPPDTAEYIYRQVLRLVGGDFVTEYQQIWISQP